MKRALVSVRRGLRRLNTSAPVLDRLHADIEDFDAEYSARIEAARTASPPEAWAEAAQRNLTNARHAVEELEVGSGYQSLLNAAREAVAGMTKAERRARVISLREEVGDKLAGSWRGKAADELLAGEPENVPVEAIREALFHMNTRSQNTYRKIALLRRQLSLVGLMVVLLVVVAVVTAEARVPGIDADTSRLFAAAVFAGLLGGTLSAAMSSTRISSRAKIPDVQRSAMITLTRTFIGAAASIPTFALLKSGLLDVNVTNNYALLFYCFLSGFSERWFLERLGDQGAKGARAEG